MLRPDTERVWLFLQRQPALAGFVLVGGSALTLHIGHRVSEDLNFAWTGGKLPAARLDALRKLASESGLEFARRDDPVADDEFVNAGMSLHDYQQDFLVNSAVKVSFFAADEPLCRVLGPSAEKAARVASLSELFASKCLVAANRSKTRDWFDLYTLMTAHGFTIGQMSFVFERAGTPAQFDIALQRLCSGRPSLHDEGYEQLAPAAPSLTAMRDFFNAQRDDFERASAANARRRE